MANSKGISVIVPVYNTEEYLKTCLNSIIHQSFKDIEIICVLDAKSDDDSEKILKNFEKKDPRIKVVKDTTGKGQGYNRNLGIKHATKEYIGFVDSDDYIDTDFYERLYDAAQMFNADVVQAEIVIKSSHTNEVIRKHSYPFSFFYTLDKIFSVIQEGVCWDKIYRTSLIKENNIDFPVDVFHEDAPFIIKVMANCNKLVITQNSFYYWMRNEFSICFNPKYAEKRIKDANTVMNIILDYLNEIKTTKDENKVIIKFMLERFGALAINDDRYKNTLTKSIEKLIQ